MLRGRRPHRLAALITSAALVVAAPAGAAVTHIEAESMAGGLVFASPDASGGKALLLKTTSGATRALTTDSAARLVVRARGTQCSGAPMMRVAIDGVEAARRGVDATAWTEYAFDAAVLAGRHTVAVTFANDYQGSGCDRDLRLDYVRLEAIDTAATNPLRSRALYVDPLSEAAATAAAWRDSRPADAALIDKIARRPQATWIGDFSGDVADAVRTQVDAATASGAVPTLVAYNIPRRDCGRYSSGGARSADAYKAWIRAFAAALGTSAAIVILEPDALASLDCLSPAARTSRFAMIADAVTVLAGRPDVATYVDIGHSGWQSPQRAAERLVRAGVARARGFSLNVANFNWSSDEEAYGRDISARLGGKGFVVDTSRNGRGPALLRAWCNPPGRGLGAAPSSAPAGGADANLWVKRPGESDGACNGGPDAGAWWPDYALGLARRSAP